MLVSVEGTPANAVTSTQSSRQKGGENQSNPQALRKMKAVKLIPFRPMSTSMLGAAGDVEITL